MSVAATVVVALIALIHVYIAIFEMFLWEQRGPKVFSSFDRDLFPKTVALAQNQGIYNAFLAAGLIWSLFISTDDWQRNVAVAFLLMVAVAGVVGALTAERRIAFVQTVPAVIGLVLVLI